MQAAWTHCQRHAQFELALLRKCWFIVLIGLVVMYVHNVMHNLAYVLHEPSPALHDIGFAAFPLLTASVWLALGDNLVWLLLACAVVAVAAPFASESAAGSTMLYAAPQDAAAPKNAFGISVAPLPASPVSVAPAAATASSAALDAAIESDTVASAASHAHAATTTAAATTITTATTTITVAGADNSSASFTVSSAAIVASACEADESPLVCSGCFRIGAPAPPRFAVLMLSRFFAALTIGQLLRIGAFLVTQLPGPAPWCQPGAANYNPPSSALQVFFRFDTATSCGDLLFSSHQMFCSLATLCVLQYYRSAMAAVAMLAVQLFDAFLLISGQRHYSVDIFVSWYTVPLVWIALNAVAPDPSADTLRRFFEKRGVSMDGGAGGAADPAGSVEMQSTD